MLRPEMAPARINAGLVSEAYPRQPWALHMRIFASTWVSYIGSDNGAGRNEHEGKQSIPLAALAMSLQGPRGRYSIFGRDQSDWLRTAADPS